MGDGPETYAVQAADEPHPKLVELSDILIGTWRVTGPDIAGLAEYRTGREGLVLVADVDFSVSGSRMKIIQHISYDHMDGTLRARYMDAMGGEATYTWVLDHPEIRVSLENADSDTYFQAVLNQDNSEYIGTWHYPEGGPPDSTEVIVYTRVEDAV